MTDNGPLSAILADYLQALDAGASPDRAQLLARHPDLAEQLQDFFARQDALFPTAQTPPPARSLPAAFGPYSLLEEIGRGGMGVVYRARHEELRRVVALKVLTGGIGQEAGERERFQQESQTLARLDHPGIVTVFEVGEHDGQAYFAMNLIDGPDLRTRLAALRENLTTGVGVLVAVCRAVQFAHDRGVIHRDLKLANILQDSRGAVFVTDFGLAHRLDQNPGLTATGALVGTPAYMAPEQVTGQRTISPATDVWALGVILYELLTGRLPFRGDTPLQTLHLVEAGLVVRPRDIEPGADPALEKVCLSCLQHHPGDRYPSAEALAEDLERWSAGRVVSLPRRSRRRLIGRWGRGFERSWLRWTSGLTRPSLRRKAVMLAVLAVSGLGAWSVSLVAGLYLELGRAEADVSQGKLEAARKLSRGQNSGYFWLGFDPGAQKQARLNELMGEHLFGNLEGATPSARWEWSRGGRWLICSTESGNTDQSFVCDGWNGTRQSPEVVTNEAPEPRNEQSPRLSENGVHFGPRDRDPPVEAPKDWAAQPETLIQEARQSRWFPASAGLSFRTLSGGRAGANRQFLLPAWSQPESGSWGGFQVAWSVDDRLAHLFLFQTQGNVRPGRMNGDGCPLLQATFDVAQGRWVRLVDSDLRVYRPPADFHAMPPADSLCTLLGRPRILELCAGPDGSSHSVVFRLSPDGTRLLTIWRRTGVMHVWRMPGSEEGT